MTKRRAPKTRALAKGLVHDIKQAAATRRATGYRPGFSVDVPSDLGDRIRRFCVDCATATGQRVVHRVAVSLLVQAGLEALEADMRKAAQETLKR